MNNPGNMLPKKCCAKCGFLYGYTDVFVSTADQAIFDPDLFRGAHFDKLSVITHQENVSTYPKMSGSGISHYKFEKLKSINCFQQIFAPLPIIARDAHSAETAIKGILKHIRADRSECEYFVPHHSGFSAKEHAEIRLQEQREEAQREYQDQWNELLHKAHEQEEVHRKWNLVITIVLGIVATVLTVAQIIIPSLQWLYDNGIIKPR